MEEKQQGKGICGEIEPLLTQAINNGVMPGAVTAIAVVKDGLESTCCLCSRGFTARTGGKRPVRSKTVYDLASLTKPLVTVLTLLHLAERKIVDLEMGLSELLPFCKVPGEKKNIQLRHLLSHCSGLPAYRPYFIEALQVKRERRKEFYLQHILKEPLLAAPGVVHVYSDLGFMLLGFAIEQLTGQELDDVYSTNIVEPLGLQNELWFQPDIERVNREYCAPTEICPWTRKILQGIVHDENCRAMGGVAGHAGLFGTADGVLNLCIFLVQVWKGLRTTTLFSRELLHTFLTRLPNTTWACGFDTPSSQQSSSGRHFSQESFGHLGFTGTSLWMDMQRGVIIVLLTNRVHPSRQNISIRQFRPQLHDAIMKFLLSDKNPCSPVVNRDGYIIG